MVAIGSVIALSEDNGSPRTVYVRGHFVTPEEQQRVIDIVADHLREEFEWRYDDYEVPRLSVGACLYARWVFAGSDRDDDYGNCIHLREFRTYREKQRGAFAVTAVHDQDQLDREEWQKQDEEEWEVKTHTFLLTWFPELTELHLDSYNRSAEFNLPGMKYGISWHEPNCSSLEDEPWTIGVTNADHDMWNLRYASRRPPKHLLKEYAMSNQHAAEWTVERLLTLIEEAEITSETVWSLEDEATIATQEDTNKAKKKQESTPIAIFDLDQHEPKAGHAKLLSAAPQLAALALRLLQEKESK